MACCYDYSNQNPVIYHIKVDKGLTDLKKGTKFNPRFFILLLEDVIKFLESQLVQGNIAIMKISFSTIFLVHVTF